MRPHEAANFVDTGQVHARSDVDKHQRGENVGAIAALRLAFGQQRSDAAERSTDTMGFTPERRVSSAATTFASAAKSEDS